MKRYDMEVNSEVVPVVASCGGWYDIDEVDQEIDRLQAKVLNLDSQLSHAEAALRDAYALAGHYINSLGDRRWAPWAAKHVTALRQAGVL